MIRPRHCRGFALLVVLWGGVLITVVAGSFAYSMRTETNLSANLLSEAQATALAESGIHLGIFALLSRSKEELWQTDARDFETSIGPHTVRVTATSESGKIDLNRAPEPLITAAVAAAVQDPDVSVSGLADAILDWRDHDDEARPQGAEKTEYEAAGLPYGPRNGPFQSIEELDQVLGMTDGAYQHLRHTVTVYARQRRLDPQWASRATLLSLPGLSESQVHNFIERRDERAAEGLPAPTELLGGASKYLARSRSPVYTVVARVRLPTGAVGIKRAIVNLTRKKGDPYSIMMWAGNDGTEMPAGFGTEARSE